MHRGRPGRAGPGSSAPWIPAHGPTAGPHPPRYGQSPTRYGPGVGSRQPEPQAGVPPEDADPPVAPQQEVMFPVGQSSEFQKEMDQPHRASPFIGLEFIIEIQHNTAKKTSPFYACLLCDAHIKCREGNASTLDLIKSHVRSSAHKLSYLKKYFTSLTAKKIDPTKPVDHILVNGIIERIVQHLGPMTVKLVVGHKLFKKKAKEIKDMVEKSSHHRESHALLKLLYPFEDFDLKLSLPKPLPHALATPMPRPVPCKKSTPEPSTSQMEKRSKIDDYDDMFKEFEAVERQLSGAPGSEPEEDCPRPQSDDELEVVMEVTRSSPKRSQNSSRESRKYRDLRGSRSGSRERGPPSSKPSGSRARETELNAQSRSRQAPAKPRSRSRGRHSRRVRSKSKDRQLQPRSRSRSRERRRSKRSGSKDSGHFDKAKIDQIKRFLIAEGEVIATHALERDSALVDPPGNKFYAETWSSFYRSKQQQYQTSTVHIDYIQDEWTLHWKKVIQSEFDRKVKEDRNRLLNRFKLFRRDLTEYQEESQRRKATLSLTPPVSDKSPVKSTAKDQQSPSKAKARIVQEDVTVIGTLRLLSALETIMDNLGLRINFALGKANNMEVNSGFASSMEMVNDEHFFKLIDSAREKLRFKMANEAINAQQVQVAMICIENISILMDQSTCKPAELIEISCSKSSGTQPTGVDPNEEALRAAIAKTVVEEFKKVGLNVRNPQLAEIVEVQFQRVKSQMKPEVDAQQPPKPLFQGYAPGPKPSQEAMNPTAPVGPLNVDWNALQSAILTASSGPSKAQTTSNDHNSTDLDDLTIEDLTSLFKNFKELDQENQKNLIEYMKKIEKTQPRKVAELKKHIH
eukprot:maker-scaffold135_size322082-snap-gene-0.12 protein:Tk07962 transcript:maker-scaffold135_size322082-snap-gene-0.12-mRNA-1 annotation:"GH12290"